MKKLLTVNNPWAGLSSYEDPRTAEREGREPKKFCGRDDESHAMTQLVSGNIFVTLYGKSGTGKTSLLNAGIFPRLREKRYMPVSIRLSMDALDTSFQQCIVSQLTKTVTDSQGRQETVNVVPLPDDEQQPDYLWSFFARTRFINSGGQTLFPVIVLDQFEEVFRDRRNEAEALLRQIAYLADESHALSPRTVDGVPYKYDFNFRFVASIREDDLYRLEDSIDNNYLPELKRCRYRLRSLTQQGARDAILIPGEGLFEPSEENAIVNKIIDKSRNEDGSISTNIISLLCSRIYVDFQKQRATLISSSLVDTFIKGNPFEQFYKEATHGFSNRERSYIEDHLVDSTGRRNSLPEGDFLLHVKNGAALLEGTRKILQRTSTSSDGEQFRLELIHDSFCEPLTRMKEKREKQRKRRWFIIAAAITLVSLSVGAYFIYLYSELKHSKAMNEVYNEEIDEMDLQIEEKDQMISEKDSLMIGMDLKSRAFDATSTLLQRILTDEGNRYDDLKHFIYDTPELKPYIITEDVTYLGNGVYEVDGVKYPAPQLSDDEIREWKEINKQVCMQKINGVEFDIPENMRLYDPCAVYLVLKSKSLGSNNERQNWFDLWSLMNEEQVLKLYDILYRENYKLATINIKYEISGLNSQAYEKAKTRDYDGALELINQAISKKPDEAYLYDSKGEFLLMKGDTQGAVEMWQKVMEIAPDFLDNYNDTELHKQLKEQGLID